MKTALLISLTLALGGVESTGYFTHDESLPMSESRAIQIDPLGEQTHKNDVKANRENLTTPRFNLSVIPTPDTMEKKADLENWLHENAIPISTVDPRSDCKDLQPLRRIVGDARIVCLGEATHGTSEFFELKHRIFEFLVEKMGFSIFSIEASMPEAYDVNEFVLTGRGDPEKAIGGLYFWTWDTEEILDLVLWMRQYNANPAHKRKVKFYGFDMQFAPRAALITLEYLRRVDPQTSPNGVLSMLSDPVKGQNLGCLSGELRRQIMTSVDSALLQLLKHKKEYSTRSSVREWEIVCQHARVLSQCVRLQTALDGLPGIRDSSMAENIRWIFNFESPGSKMVVWAHNGHVATWAPGHTPSMGTYLRGMFGSNMVVIGFAFNQGSFRAIELPLPSQEGLHEFTLGPAPSGSLDSALASAGLSIAAIDLRTVPKVGPVADFFAHPLATRSIGGGFAYPLEKSTLISQEIPKLYDGIVFVEKTTSTHPLMGGQRPPVKTLLEPTNLDFERVGADGEPTDWNIPPNLSNFDFQVSSSKVKPHQGNNCATIERRPGRHYGETFGSISQQINPGEYRGKRLTIRAAVRMQREDDSTRGYLWIAFGRFGTAVGDAGYKWTPANSYASSDNWQECEVAADIPVDAVTISYGLALVGSGKASIDDVSLSAPGSPPWVTHLRFGDIVVFVMSTLLNLMLLGAFLSKSNKNSGLEFGIRRLILIATVPIVLVQVYNAFGPQSWWRVTSLFPLSVFLVIDVMSRTVRSLALRETRLLRASNIMLHIGLLGLVAYSYFVKPMFGYVALSTYAGAILTLAYSNLRTSRDI